MKALLALVVLQLLCHGAQAVTCNQLCTCTVSYTCDACVPYATRTTGADPCICDSGYSAYQKGSLSYCIKCDSTCTTCFGPNINNCVSCPTGFTFNSSQSTCAPPNNATVATIESSYKFLGFGLLTTWATTGMPTTTNCDLYSLVGGYASSTATDTISTSYPSLPGHYETRILAAFFWVSSAAKPTFSIKVVLSGGTSPTAQYTQTIPTSSSNGTCAAGEDYWAINIDQTLTHGETAKTVTFQTTGGVNGGQYWGIRQYVLILNLCYSATCKTCHGPLWNDCDSCTDSHRSESVTGYASECRCYGTGGDAGNYFRHYDHTVDLCVNPCPSYPSQYYGDPTTRDCVTNCPTTPPTVPTGWNLYFADDTVNQCMPTCTTPISINSENIDVYHDVTNQKCVTNCPSTEPYKWDTNMTCYAVCPNSQFVDLRTMKCTTVCPNTPDPPMFGFLQANPVTTTSFCVEVCPTGTYADPHTQTCQAVCTWSGSNKYFFDTSTGYRKCVLICPLPNYFGDTSTKTCVQTCPVGTYGDNNSADRYCRGTCSGGWFGLTTGTRICVQDCPFGTWATTADYTCVTTSTDCGAQYADNNTRSCVNGGSCSLGQFALLANMSCVTYCTSTTFGNNLGFCASSCSGSYFSDRNIHLCVTECFTQDWYADVGSGNDCVATCNFSDLYPFADNTTKKCVDICPGTEYFADSILHKCVLNCTPGTYAYSGTANHTCVTHCPSPYYGDNSTGTGICVMACPAQPVMFGDPNDASGRVCVYVCTMGSYGDETGNRQCTANCPTIYFAQNDTNRRCVTRCGANTYGMNHFCYTALNCPSGFGDDTTNLCVSPCPDLNVTFGDSISKMCVKTCPNVTGGSPMIYFADPSTRRCTATCSSTVNPPLFGNNNTQFCVQKCIDADSYADAQSTHRYCISTCAWVGATIYYRNKYTKICVLSTGCPTNYFGDNSTLDCVFSCPRVNGNQTWGYYPTRTCLQECYASTWGDASTGLGLCVGICPTVPPKWSYDGNMTCMSTCPTAPSMYGEDFTRTCQGTCPFSPELGATYNTYSYEPTRRCLKTCPDTYFADVTVRKCWSDPASCPASAKWGDPHTHMCTSLCTGPTPIDSYGDNSTHLCTTFCTAGSYADNYTSTRTCVGTCPGAYNSYGDPSTHSCVLHCVTPLTWANSLTHLCEYTCTGTRYAEDITRTCVVALNCPTVPAYLFGDNNTWHCVQSCKYTNAVIEWADNTTRTCVPQCPNTTNTRFYGDTSTGVPICVITCPVSPVLFGLNSTNRCVSECPGGLYGDQNFNRSCLTLCPNISGVVWFSQITHHICVTICENYTYGNYGNQHCEVTPFDCPSGYFGDDSTHLCVNLCPQPMNFFGDLSTKLCVSLCPNVSTAVVNASAGINEPVGIRYSDVSTRLCVQTCPDSYGLHGTFGDNATNNCVEVCPLGTYGDPQTTHRVCVLACSQAFFESFADPSTRRCVPQCPSSPPLYGQTTNYKCVATCTGSTYKNAVNRQCVGLCPAGQYSSVWPQNICVDVCPSNPDSFGQGTACVLSCSSGFANTVTRTCVAGCSPIFEYGGRCVQYCPNGYYANSTYNCVLPANCGASRFAQNSTRTCQLTCAEGFADTASHYCIGVCPANTYGDVNVCTGTCITPSTSASNVWNLCVATCPALTYSNGTDCIPSCVGTTYADDSTQTCTPLCPTGSQNTYGALTLHKCVLVCPTTYFRDITQFCKNNCNPRFADNITLNCQVQCADGSWGDQNSWACLSLCVSGEYGYLTDRICYLPLNLPSGAPMLFGDPISRTYMYPCQLTPTVYFGDPNTGVCVTRCPNIVGAGGATTIYYGDPNTRNCQLSCSNLTYSADPSLNLCVLQCSDGLYTTGVTAGLSGICMAACSIGYADPTTRSCVSTCPVLAGTFGFTNTTGGFCLSLCPLNNFAYPIGRVCTTHCTAPYFAYTPTRQCVLKCNNSFSDVSGGTNVCSATCSSASYPYADNSTNQCVPVCPSTPDYYGSSNVCVFVCPTGQFADSSTRLCVPTCPTLGSGVKTYGDSKTGKCQTACTVGTYGSNGTMTCVSTCPSSTYADNTTGKCTLDCSASPGTFADPLTTKCTNLCSSNLFGDSFDYKCRRTCISGTYGDSLSKTCVSPCPAAGYTFGENGTERLCVASCLGYSGVADPISRLCRDVCQPTTVPQLYAEYTKAQCVQRCPNGTYAEDSTFECLGACLTGFADYSTYHCVPVCPSYPELYGDTGTKTCVKFCPGGFYSDNSTNMCVGPTACNATSDYFSDPLTGRCVLFCSEGYWGKLANRTCITHCVDEYADNLTRRCVPICPGRGTEDTFADSFSMRCVRVCPGSTYAENLTKTCQSTCTSGYSDPVSKYCVGRCPSQPLSFGYNAICYPVCPTDGSGNQLYGDFDSQTCLGNCPVVGGVVYFADPGTKTCVTVCPVGSNLWGDTNIFVCRGTCISSEYRNPATQQCIATCPTDPDLYADDSSGNCVRTCPGTYAEVTTRKCQAACNTFGATPYKDSSTYRCVAVCPSKPFTYADNSSWTCTTHCTTGTYADNKTQSCVPQCPAIWNYYADIPNGICVETCPNGTFGTNGTQVCGASCVNSFADNQTNLCLANCSTKEGYYADNQNWKCVYACPSNAYAHDIDQTCKVNAGSVSTCPGSYFADPSTKKCVLFCPLGRFAYTTTKTCETGCTGSYYADNTTRTCVTVCPVSPSDLTTYFADPTTHTCVQTCPSGYFAEGRVCSQTCSVYFAYNLTRTCQPACPHPYFADSNLHVCGLTCSVGYASSITRTCDGTCPSFTFADNTTMTCVMVCNTGYADSAIWVCVSACTGGTFADPSTLTCVNNCPAQPQLWADSTNMRCVQTCSSNSYFRYNRLRICSSGCPNDTTVTPTELYYADSSTQNCVLQCPIGLATYADNTTNFCTSLCTLGTFADDITKTCVSQCPNTPVLTYAHSNTRQCQQVCLTGFGDPISRTCVPTCPSNSWGDPNSRKCVTFCPDNYYAYNATQMCLYLSCNVVSSLYADNTTHSCVTTCPASADLFGDPSSGICVLYCPANRYAEISSQSCVLYCSTVNGVHTYAYGLTNECLQACPSPYIAFDITNRCILSCPDPYFKNLTSNACSRCPVECLQCIKFEECTLCATGFKLFSGVCNSSCTRSSPLVYANPLTDACVVALLCPPGYFGDNATLVCTQVCPAKTYGETSTKVCQKCPQSCATCTSPSTCQTCEGTAVLASDGMCYFQCNSTHIYNYNGQCYNACPNGTYLTSNNVICANCASMCLTCNGTSTNCLSCFGMFNYQGQCLATCPMGYYGTPGYTCQICTASIPACVLPVNFSSTMAVQDYKYIIYISFNQQVTFKKSLDQLLDIKLSLTRMLATLADYVNSGIPFDYTLLPNGTIRVALKVDITLVSPKFSIIFTDPSSIISVINNGTLQNVINLLSVFSIDYYPPDAGVNAGTNTLTVFMSVALLIFVFLGWLFVPLSFMHALHTFQLLYLHIYINYIMPANLYYYLKGLQLTMMSFLPNILAKGLPAGYLNVNVPQRIVDLHGDFNFSRNAGSVLFIVLVYLFIGGLISILSTRIIPNRIWRNFFKGMLQQRILYSAFHEVGFIFFLNVLFFGFLQFKDMTAPVPYEGFNIFIMLVFVLAMLILPFALIIKLAKHREDLQPIQENFQFAYRFHKTEGANLYFSIIYYFRGILFVVFLTALFEYPLGQLISLMIINLALLIMLLVLRPYKEVSVNVMHILFELSLLFIEGLMTYGYYNQTISVTSKLNYGYIGIVTLGVLLTIFMLWNVFRWAVGIRAFWQMFKQTEFYKEYADEDYQNEIEQEFIDVQKKPVVEVTEGDIVIEKIYKQLNEDGKVTIKIKKKKKKLRPKKKKKAEVEDAQLFEELEEEDHVQGKKPSDYVRINPENIFDLKANNVPPPAINRHFDESEQQRKEEEEKHSDGGLVKSSADDDDRPMSIYSDRNNLSIEHRSIEHLPEAEYVEEPDPKLRKQEESESEHIPVSESEQPSVHERQVSPRQPSKRNDNIIMFEDALDDLAEGKITSNAPESHPWMNTEVEKISEIRPVPQPQKPQVVEQPPKIQQKEETAKIGHFFDDLLSQEAQSQPKQDVFALMESNPPPQNQPKGVFGEEEVASELEREENARKKKKNADFLFEDFE